MADLKFFQQFAGTPAGQGLLRAIRAGEGTSGPKGYQTMFGGGTFNDLSRHPDRVIKSGGYASTAAGAYQFLTPTWNEVAGRLGLKDFSPQSQDVAALAKARERLMPLGGLAIVEKEGLSPRVAAALAPEWASFPTMSGKSYYGQPVKPLTTLQQAFGQGKTSAPATSQSAQQAAQATQIPTPQAKANSLLDMFKQEVMLGLLSPGVSAIPTSDPFSLLGLLGR